MMKQTLITRLVLGAIAGLAATGAYAGQIQASSVSIAREVIISDAQTITSPSIAYRFAGDVDARVQAQTFQVQFTLGSGAWAVAPAVDTISVSDGVSGVIQAQRAAGDVTIATAGQKAVGINATYQVTKVGLSADKKTCYVTITVNQDNTGSGALIKQPLISINVTTNVHDGEVAPAAIVGARGTVNGLFTVVGSLPNDYTTSGKCVDVKTMPVSFKHYVALSSPNDLATDTTATPDEHNRGGATNNATLIVFPTNVKVNIAASTGGAILTPGGNLTFSASGAGTSWVDANTVMLGSVTLSQNAVGYDSDLSHQYLLAGVGSGGSVAGLDDVATATSNVGDVEVNTVTTVVTASQGFAVGSTLYASTAANCGALVAGSTTAAVTAGTAAGPITVTIPNISVEAAFGVSGTGPIYICYDVDTINTVPSSSFSAVTTVNKAAAGVHNEQNNICSGNFYALGGGIKIDVRNYASSKETSGYQSVIRFINNSDTAAADVWGQIIHQDGKLGAWGKIVDLPVRAVVNMTAAQIEAKLTNAATAAIGPNAAVAQAATATSSDTAPRLRITSTSGKSLRVQNYLFNSATNQILEGSGQQGVDFEGTALRAPGSEGQYQDQDANSGINLSK